MQLAILLSAFLILSALISIARRPKFAGNASLRPGGKVSERIVKIEKQLCRKVEIVSKKLLREIKIFNKLKLVMPCRHGVPVIYSQYLGRLVLEPRWVLRDSDGIARLLYICAAANLYGRTVDTLVRRQLLKNMLYVFGFRDIIKKTRKLVLTQRSLFINKQARFKYLSSRFIFAQNRVDRPSYTVYENKKHYIDKVLPVECFETSLEKFSYFVSNDKFKYSLTHTSDTFFAVGEGKTIGLYVPDKVSFGSSICEKVNDLMVHATSEGNKYYVIHAKSKPEVTSIIGELKRRRGRMDYLLTADEAKEVAQIEAIFERAWMSCFVRGEGLKDKFTSACKYVPTLFLPTLSFTIEKPDDFFAVVDNFKLFRKIAQTGNSINVVFLYSSPNDEVREIIKAFIDKDEAKELISKGVFLFFVDRVQAEDKAVNYLSLMSEPPPKTRTYSASDQKDVEVVTHITNSYPITHTIYIRNTSKTAKTAKVRTPISVGSEIEGLPFGMPSICSRTGANLQVTSLKSGRSSNFKLPIGATVTDEFGRTIGEGETACNRVFVGCDVKLGAFEEKVLKIVKGEGGISRAGQKQTFLGSLENVMVKGDLRLQRIFEMNVTDGTDDKLCSALKESIRNFDISLFFALLAKRDTISSDVYAVIINRVIGIKLLRGKIQLMPCIAITGSFELCFSYKDMPYNFHVKQKGGGFTVNYGDTEHRNFLQVAVE